jgi:hypothetical protein
MTRFIEKQENGKNGAWALSVMPSWQAAPLLSGF